MRVALKVARLRRLLETTRDWLLMDVCETVLLDVRIDEEEHRDR